MGDRSWARFRVRNADADKAAEIIGRVDDRRDVNGTTDLEIYETTGGGYDAACELRAAGIPHKWICAACPGSWDNTLSVFDGVVEVEFSTNDSWSPVLEADGFSVTDAKVEDFRRKLKELQRIEEFLRS
jgi:hypothetical protein